MAFTRSSACGVLLLASASRARAQAGPPAPETSLSWIAPQGCPSRADVLTEVRRLLGDTSEDPFPLARAEIALAGPSGFRLTIWIQRDPAGPPRTVDAPNCAELGDTAALIFALAINPSAVASAARLPSPAVPSAPPPPPAPGGTAAAVEAPAAPQGAAPLTQPGAGPALRGHLMLGGDVGTFAGPAPALWAGASFTRGILRFEAAALLVWGGRMVSPPAPTKGGDFWLAGGTLLACYEGRLMHGVLRNVGVAACAGVEAGGIVATSFGVAQRGQAGAPWVAPVGEGLLRWAFSRRWALRLDLSIAVPVVRPSFELEGLGRIYMPGPIAGRVGAGFEVDIDVL